MATKTTVLRVNVKALQKANLRGARQAYAERLIAHNNKPVQAFVQSCAANPPSTPARGKYKGKPEPINGWLSWFKRNGYLETASK